MSRSLVYATVATGFAALMSGGAALAEVPRVVTDIPPVQGLVAQVMKGVGEPALLVQPGASPHGYSLRPSEAKSLEQAQAVFFVGPELTPWLVKPIETLAPKAEHIELLDAEGTTKLPNRSGATFEAHVHSDGEGHDHDHAHEGEGESAHDHDHTQEGEGHHHDHAHGDAAGEPEAHDHDHEHDHEHDHAAEGEAHDHDHGHDHGATDPHAWLDPENGKVWLSAIAAELSKLDPEHKAQYEQNARDGAAAIDAAAADAKGKLAELGDVKFIVFHDAYQYFEKRMGISAAGSISLSDASAPSPARIAELREKVKSLSINCALAEPQFNADLLKTVFEGSDAKTATLDPLGSAIPPGPDFYPALIRSLATELSNCGTKG